MIGVFDGVGFRRHARSFVAGDLDVSLDGKRAIITGANSGLGFAAAHALLKLGARVELWCRDAGRGEAARIRLAAAVPGARVDLRVVDLSEAASVEESARAVFAEGPPVDLLVHNAGLLPSVRTLNAEGQEATFATHVAGPHRLTARLADHLAPGARVVFVSSGGMLLVKLSLGDLDWSRRRYDGVAAYAQTKRMQVVLAEEWARRLDGRAHVYSMHPGWADTPGVQGSLPTFRRLTRPLLRTADEGADTIVWLCARRLPPEPSGALFFDRRPANPYAVPFTRESPAERARFVALVDALLVPRG